MKASSDLTWVGVSGGDPISSVASLFPKLDQNSRGLCPGSLSIGMPELYLREIGFVRAVAVWMPE